MIEQQIEKMKTNLEKLSEVTKENGYSDAKIQMANERKEEFQEILDELIERKKYLEENFPTLDEFQKMLENFDWNYHMTDDEKEYFDAIKQIEYFEEVISHEKSSDDYVKLFEQFDQRQHF